MTTVSGRGFRPPGPATTAHRAHRSPAPDDGAVALPEQAVLDVLAQASGGLGRMAEEVERWRSTVSDLADLACSLT